MTSRRTWLKACAGTALGSMVLPGAARAGQQQSDCKDEAPLRWGLGPESQRRADLGNGYFFNPIVPGDHPDPTVLKDGDNYYMTFSSFDTYPGIIIWHSKDLVNWTPLGPALHKPIGTVWALDLCKVGDRYYVYIPAAEPGKPWSIYVIWTDDIRGTWSDPIDLDIPHCIDPGHAVGEDGKRYLFVNGIRKILLRDDGLATQGELQAAYEPWRYPESWITENFAPEGPKITRHNGWFYLITAVGGTAGPVTGHMVIAARSRSIHGPWEHCPNNPLVRTESEDELWWSRGHATLVEGPSGAWWMIYHGYERDFRTLGRQTLLEPIEWTDDGWFRALGGDLSSPLPLPAQRKQQVSGLALSDDFSVNTLGARWHFYRPGPDEQARLRFGREGLLFEGRGQSLADSSPLTCVPVDRAYEVSVELTLLDEHAEAALGLFYNEKAYVGVGFSRTAIKSYQYAEEQTWARQARNIQTVQVALVNDEHVITYRYSFDGGEHWQTHPTRMEVSGMHHNVFGGFLCLRPALFSLGKGRVRYANFRYRALREGRV